MAHIIKAGVWIEKRKPLKGEFDLDQWLNSNVPSSSWGSIGGTLSSQTDLQAALDAKDDVITFSNGLTRTVNAVVLGGVLTEATTITSPATGSRLTFSGFPVQYDADLSASYTDRSLIDRGAANNLYWKTTGTTTLTGTSYIYGPTIDLGIYARQIDFYYYDDFDVKCENSNTSGQCRLYSNNKVELRRVENIATYGTNGVDNRFSITAGAELSRHTVNNTAGVVNGLTITRTTPSTIDVAAGIGLYFNVGGAVAAAGVTTGIEYSLTDNTNSSHDSKYTHSVLVNHVSTAITDLDRYGWRYLADYSANYTDRSLADKGYVDAAVSDVRLKENITDFNNTLEKVNLLRPVEFDMIATKEHKSGFIAQEVEGLFPNMILDDEGTLKIKRDEWFPIMIKAIQELSQKVKDLEAKLK